MLRVRMSEIMREFVDVNSISPEQIAAEIGVTADVEMLTIGGFYREARRIKAISYLQFI